jgi:hypothetical protein
MLSTPHNKALRTGGFFDTTDSVKDQTVALQAERKLGLQEKNRSNSQQERSKEVPLKPESDNSCIYLPQAILEEAVKATQQTSKSQESIEAHKTVSNMWDNMVEQEMIAHAHLAQQAVDNMWDNMVGQEMIAQVDLSETNSATVGVVDRAGNTSSVSISSKQNNARDLRSALPEHVIEDAVDQMWDGLVKGVFVSLAAVK